MTFHPVLPQKRRAFETKITFLSGLGAEIAILVFAACWSTVPPPLKLNQKIDFFLKLLILLIIA